ncbi:hypothetical protein [Pararhodobacter sp. CCB-MM2]|nr:hypothetical protein [Pararhodobacter sp. CCB-MM2]
MLTEIFEDLMLEMTLDGLTWGIGTLGPAPSPRVLQGTGVAQD